MSDLFPFILNCYIAVGSFGGKCKTTSHHWIVFILQSEKTMSKKKWITFSQSEGHARQPGSYLSQHVRKRKGIYLLVADMNSHLLKFGEDYKWENNRGHPVNSLVYIRCSTNASTATAYFPPEQYCYLYFESVPLRGNKTPCCASHRYNKFLLKVLLICFRSH